ncbi:fructose-bisphosphate aldolase [Candidatus Woesearchaeota archaeon]|nr:fructose-bisphosphate aldolase [Candidatus Woesearchaeota archaeon]
MHDKIRDLLNENKALFLSMDQGLEHGPKDFNLTTIDPKYVLEIALKGQYSGMILQKGIAEKYYENYRHEIPLIIKVNGKTSLVQTDPYSPQLCSVKNAVKLGAKAVGYTIYLGSSYEAEMLREFSKIAEEAHDHGIPVIAWMYPRGSFIQNEADTDLLAYAARVGLELGADFIKMKYNGDKQGMKWVVKCAGKTRVLVAGGEKTAPEHLLQETYEVIQAGATGLAIGRNVWQSSEPLKITEALKAIVFNKKTPEQAVKLLK